MKIDDILFDIIIIRDTSRLLSWIAFRFAFSMVSTYQQSSIDVLQRTLVYTWENGALTDRK
jgi:hypothetical protein